MPQSLMHGQAKPCAGTISRMNATAAAKKENMPKLELG